MEDIKINNSENNLSKEERKELDRLKRQEKFINKFISIWGSDNFDFSQVYYIDHDNPITLFHNILGTKTATPDMFLKKGFEKVRSWEEWKKDFKEERIKSFISKIENYFGENYFSFEEMNFRDMNSPITLIVNKTGEIQTKLPSTFIKEGKRFKETEKKKLEKQENFIKKVYQKFGDKFDFKDVKYVNLKTPVILYCKDHNNYRFETRPDVLLRSPCGCPLCLEEHNKEIYQNNINKAGQKTLSILQEKFKGKLDFSNSIYTGNSNYINFICYKHGEQRAIASNLLTAKHGCPKCANEAISAALTSTQEDFVKKAKDVHGDKYSYDKSIYINSSTPVEIYCNECQEYFWQTPANHIYLEQGHEKCCGWHRRTDKEIRKELELKCGNKFDFSQMIFKGMSTPIEAICKAEGHHFWRRPNDFLYGEWDCPYCTGNYVKTTEEYQTFLKDYFGDAYDFSEVEYINSSTPVKIICPEHGPFYKTPQAILQVMKKGAKVLCPHCSESSGEHVIFEFLQNNDIKWESQKRFKECRYKNPLAFDFYLPDFNLCIEYQGEQHFKVINYDGRPIEDANKALEINQIRDQIKRDYCKNNKISLLEIYYDISLDQINSLLEKFLNNYKFLEKPAHIILSSNEEIVEPY